LIIPPLALFETLEQIRNTILQALSPFVQNRSITFDSSRYLKGKSVFNTVVTHDGCPPLHISDKNYSGGQQIFKIGFSTLNRFQQYLPKANDFNGYVPSYFQF